MSALETKIREKSLRVAVMGVGYVGLPLAVEFARAGFFVLALDQDPARVAALKSGRSYIRDVSDAELAPHLESERLRATSDPQSLEHADAVVVCVPTPLNKTKDPDLRFIAAAAEQVARHQHPDMLVVLESTTYPGTTSELFVPMLTGDRFKIGEDVFVAFSPERVDPGNSHFGIRNTPKVLGGETSACLALASALYAEIIDELVPVSSTTAAEMTKLLENTFRAVNIGLVNEMALLCRHIGVDPFEVIRAASTKPFGFMPFFPGPGLGGHCIPVDPLFLSWKLRGLRHRARFIDLADAINSAMPEHVVERLTSALNDHERVVRGSQILLYGVAYKPNVADTRESPALSILELLEKKGARVEYLDPHVPHLLVGGRTLESVATDADFGAFDAVVIVTDHDALDRERLLEQARLILDTRDALHSLRNRNATGSVRRVYGL